MKTISTSGKRKKSIARATLTEGSGKITINKFDLELFGSEMTRLKVKEPIILAGDTIKKVDLDIKVSGGGSITQADAIRLAIGRALVEFSPKLKELYLDYDRQLLVADVRVKESAKPNNHGQARAKKQTSYRWTIMIIPIRCFSCGKPVAHLWEEYNLKVEKGEDRKKVLDNLGLERYCCRGMFLGHVDLIDEASKFKKF